MTALQTLANIGLGLAAAFQSDPSDRNTQGISARPEQWTVTADYNECTRTVYYARWRLHCASSKCPPDMDVYVPIARGPEHCTKTGKRSAEFITSRVTTVIGAMKFVGYPTRRKDALKALDSPAGYGRR